MNDHVAELRELKSDRGFGLGSGVFFVLLSCLAGWKGWWQVSALSTALGGGLVCLSAVLMPPLWRLPRRAWMRLGHGLGWLNSRIIYSFAFLFMFAPVALVYRLLGSDLLEPDGAPSDASNWRARRPKRPARAYLEPY